MEKKLGPPGRLKRGSAVVALTASGLGVFAPQPAAAQNGERAKSAATARCVPRKLLESVVHCPAVTNNLPKPATVETAKPTLLRHVVLEQTGRDAVKLKPDVAAASSPWEKWARLPDTRRIVQCESSNRVNMETDNGGIVYTGLYSDDLNFWDTYDLWNYAPVASQATRAEQDRVNFNGYEHRGYEPWQCAQMLGID